MSEITPTISEPEQSTRKRLPISGFDIPNQWFVKPDKPKNEPTDEPFEAMRPTEIAVLTARPPSTLRLTTKTTSTLSTTSTPSTTPVNLHFTVPTEEPRTVIPRNVKIMPPPTTPPVTVIKISPSTYKKC